MNTIYIVCFWWVCQNQCRELFNWFMLIVAAISVSLPSRWYPGDAWVYLIVTYFYLTVSYTAMIFLSYICQGIVRDIDYMNERLRDCDEARMEDN